MPADELFRRNAELMGYWLGGETGALTDALAGDAQAARLFLDFLDRQHLRFQFMASLEGSELRSLFATATLIEWERSIGERRARQAGLVEELADLDDLLRSRGIDYRLLKGPFLGQRFFGGVERRPFGDLDLLVRPAHFAEVDALVVATGFERLSALPFGHRFATRFAHGCDYRRGACRLDLHWAPATHPSYRIDEGRLWQEGTAFEVANRRIPVLTDESALLFVAVSFFEDLDRGAGRLKSVVDLERMLTRMEGTTDWSSLFLRAEAEGFGSILPSILRLAMDFANADQRLRSLANELDRQANDAPIDWAARVALVDAAPGRLHNKLWASKLYACSRGLALGWWVLSLPMRRAVYAPISFRGMFRRKR
ncbi:MAG: nucleotidyltransferase family protein [Candidatus Binatia bacterium]|nr:nucleotidyltransferase family protein [Candidatus Binatia bacterium]